jgi:hypothetical protein
MGGGEVFLIRRVAGEGLFIKLVWFYLLIKSSSIIGE